MVCTRYLRADAPIGPVLSFSVDFATVVQLHDVTTDTVSPSGNALGLDDFTVDAYDDLFRSLGTVNLSLRTLERRYYRYWVGSPTPSKFAGAGSKP